MLIELPEELKKLVEKFEGYEEKTSYKNRNEIAVYKKTTPFEKLSYIFDTGIRKARFKQLLTLSLKGVNAIPFKIDEFRKLIDGAENGEIMGLMVLDPEETLDERMEILAEEAIKYFTENLEEMLTEAFRSYVEETLLHVMFETQDGKLIIPHISKIKFFNRIIRQRNDLFRQKMKVSTEAGKKKKTPERKREAEEVYRIVLPMVQNARNLYGKVNYLSEWRRHVKLEFPELPDDTIELLSNKNYKPSGIARMLVTKYFDNKAGIKMEEFVKRTVGEMEKDG